jgi:hypothetical protein
VNAMSRRPKRGKGVMMSEGPSGATEAPDWKPIRTGSLRDDQHIEFNPDNRVYQGIWRNGPLITDFVLVQQVKIRSRWRDVLKVDCCHGSVHVHQLTMSGRNDTRELQPISKSADLLVGLTKATDIVYDHWENNLRRWKRGK